MSTITSMSAVRIRLTGHDRHAVQLVAEALKDMRFPVEIGEISADIGHVKESHHDKYAGTYRCYGTIGIKPQES